MVLRHTARPCSRAHPRMNDDDWLIDWYAEKGWRDFPVQILECFFRKCPNFYGVLCSFLVKGPANQMHNSFLI